MTFSQLQEQAMTLVEALEKCQATGDCDERQQRIYKKALKRLVRRTSLLLNYVNRNWVRNGGSNGQNN